MYDVKLFENGKSLEQIIPCEALCIDRFVGIFTIHNEHVTTIP